MDFPQLSAGEALESRALPSLINADIEVFFHEATGYMSLVSQKDHLNQIFPQARKSTLGVLNYEK